MSYIKPCNGFSFNFYDLGKLTWWTFLIVWLIGTNIVKCPKTLVCIYQTTWHHIQETCYLNGHCHDSCKPNLLGFFLLGEKLACKMSYLVCAFTCAHAFLYEILTQRLIIVKFMLWKLEHHWRPFLELPDFLSSVINMFVTQIYEVGMTCLLSVILTVVLLLEVAAFAFVIPSWIWIVDFCKQ